MEILEEIKNKKASYEAIKQERDSQEDYYMAKRHIVEGEYDKKKKEAYASYLEVLKTLEAERDQKIEEIPQLVLSRDIVENLRDDLVQIIEENRIDHNLMCKLLTKKTGKLWQAKVVTGLCGDFESGGQMSRYGVMLVNEDHEKFNSFALSYQIEARPHLDKNAISVRLGGCWPVSERDKYQEYANGYNWILTYLDAKGVLPSFEHSGHLANCNGYENVVVEAIEEYLREKESSSDEEMGK